MAKCFSVYSVVRSAVALVARCDAVMAHTGPGTNGLRQHDDEHVLENRVASHSPSEYVWR